MAGKRGRPSSDQHDDLPEKLTARFTVLEKAALLEMCEQQGVTLSAFIRSKVFGKRLTSKSDSLMLNELRRQGGLLKHLCYEGHLSPEQINPVLANIMVALDSIVSGGDIEKLRGEIKKLITVIAKMYNNGTVSGETIERAVRGLDAAVTRFNLAK